MDRSNGHGERIEAMAALDAACRCRLCRLCPGCVDRQAARWCRTATSLARIMRAGVRSVGVRPDFDVDERGFCGEREWRGGCGRTRRGGAEAQSAGVRLRTAENKIGSDRFVAVLASVGRARGTLPLAEWLPYWPTRPGPTRRDTDAVLQRWPGPRRR